MVHGALFYHGQDAFLEEVGGFIEEGVASDQTTVALFPSGALECLRSRLGTAGGRVRFEDMAVVGRNPARILPVYQELVDPRRGRVRVVGQVFWPGRSDAETTEVMRHETLLNSVLAGADALIVCAYDTQHLTQSALEAVRRVHPQIVARNHEPHKSPDFVVDDLADGHLRDVLEQPEPPVEEIAVTIDLSVLRQRVASSRLVAPLSGSRREDFVLAINEVAANALEYGQGPRIAQLWRTGASVIAEVAARGRIDDPLAGRRRPDPAALRGRGLWIVNQLCDLVQVRQDGPTTRLRLHMHLG